MGAYGGKRFKSHIKEKNIFFLIILVVVLICNSNADLVLEVQNDPNNTHAKILQRHFFRFFKSKLVKKICNGLKL